MERLTVFDGQFWEHKGFPTVGEDTVDEFIDCVKELAERLAAIEDILGDDYDLDRLRELVEAEQEGRVRFVPKVSGAVCGTCKHFERFSGRKMGTCGVKKYASDRHRREDKSRAFVTSQANKACKRYELGKE